jgi:hypothetical protein
VPFHALPALHARVQGRIEHVEPGYVAATVTVNRFLFAGGAAASPGSTFTATPDAP